MQENEQELTEEAKSENEAPFQEPDLSELTARLKRAEAKIERMKVAEKVDKKVEEVLQKQTGQLDNADYALLAAKGIEEDSDISFIHDKMHKWGMSLREVLADKDMKEKLDGFKIEREVKAAMPSSMRRSSGGLDNLDYWKAKYDQTGQLPDDFSLRSAIINAKIDKESTNKPRWRS